MTDYSTRHPIRWIDSAKAISVLLVVLYHARHLSYMLEWTHAPVIMKLWQDIAQFCTPLRMPLFFLISGLLASRSLTQEWSCISRKRVYRLYYIYIVWALLFALAIPAFPHSLWSINQTTLRLLSVPGGLSLAWYLWALATFFVFGWVTRAVPAGFLLAIAAALAVIAVFIGNALPVQHTSMLRCLLFFMIGLRLPHIPLRLAEMASGRALLFTFGAFCAALYCSRAWGSTFNPLVDGLAVSSGIMAAKMACDRWNAFSEFGASLARLTLPIYLLHFPALVLVLEASRLLMPAVMLSNTVIAVLFPLGAASVSVFLALTLYRFALHLGQNWLFDLPRMPVFPSQKPIG